MVISDRKLLNDENANDIIDAGDYFSPEVESFSDTYPFGSPLRGYQSASYRYGFNGKEQSNDMGNAAGAVYDYGFRIYDSRIAKFTSVDPLFKSYPWYTPYQFAGNKPIRFIDLDGLEEFDTYGQFLEDDPAFVMAAFTVSIWNDAVDGLGNILSTTIEWSVSDEFEGGAIRSLLKKQGVTVPEIVQDEALGEAFKIRKRDRDIVIELEEGLSGDFWDLGIAALDVAGLISPAKGGGAFLAIKVAPITAKGISSVLKNLKLSSRAKQLSQEVDVDTDKLGDIFESQAGAILEESVGGSLRRIINSDNKAGDFLFVTGKYKTKSVDHLGIPKKALAKFKMSEFLTSITDHFNKSVDFVLLDLRSLNKEQVKKVSEHLKKNHKKDAKRLITIGGNGK